jgi:hypothetical protein
MLRHDITEILLKLALNINQSVTRKNAAKALCLVYIQKPVWLDFQKLQYFYITKTEYQYEYVICHVILSTSWCMYI